MKTSGSRGPGVAPVVVLPLIAANYDGLDDNAFSPPWDHLHTHTGVADGSQFTQTNAVTPRTGSKCAAVKVRPGDTFGAETTERCEVLATAASVPQEVAGSEFWYAWSTLWPTGWQTPVGWGIFFQIHANNALSPPFALNQNDDANGNQVVVADINSGLVTGTSHVSYNETVTLLPTLQLDVWHDWIVRYRNDIAEGIVQVYHRTAGARTFDKLLDLQAIPTMQTVANDTTVLGNYLKHGLYRNASPFTNVFYHDNFRKGHTLGSCMSAFNDSWLFPA